MLKDTLSYFIIIKIKLQCRLFGIGDLSVCGYILVKLAFNPRKTRRIL
jgi:hypothetical protein